jgi:hypothetical protein
VALAMCLTSCAQDAVDSIDAAARDATTHSIRALAKRIGGTGLAIRTEQLPGLLAVWRAELVSRKSTGILGRSASLLARSFIDRLRRRAEVELTNDARKQGRAELLVVDIEGQLCGKALEDATKATRRLVWLVGFALRVVIFVAVIATFAAALFVPRHG